GQRGPVDGLTGPLRKAGVGWSVLDRVERNATEASVLPGVEVYRREGCDGVIALGGGSAIDAGKAIRLKATHPLPLADYDALKNGGDKISLTLPLIIAVATTFGTFSDVGCSTVITMTATGRQAVIFRTC